MTIDAEAVLEFWLGNGSEFRAMWWKKDPTLDEALRQRFGEALEAGRAGGLDGWTETPRGTLGLIILLDQFSRNVHRDTPAMYAADAQAAALTRRLVRRDELDGLPPFAQLFGVMPLMHSEDMADQRLCLSLLERLAEVHPVTAGSLDSARKHAAIVERFGRFPHRNAILGRESTTEEVEFLKEPGSSF